MKAKQFKRCPRCDKKVQILIDKCDGCGLIFSRLSKASNTAAKKAIKNKEFNKVISDNILPKDVKKWKLFLWALFFGWFGMHYIKVGKYKTAIFMVIATAMVYIAAILPMDWFNHYYLSALMWMLILPASFSTIVWIVSLFQILFNKFKVPIAIDEEYIKESLDKDVVKDILNVVESTKQSEVSKQQEKEPFSIKNIKKEKIKIVCASCGAFVKVFKDEEICPKCNEPLNGD